MATVQGTQDQISQVQQMINEIVEQVLYKAQCGVIFLVNISRGILGSQV